MDELVLRVRDVIADHLDLPLEFVTPEKTLVGDLGADWAEEMQLATLMEAEFEIVIPNDASDSWETVQDAVDTVLQLLGERAREGVVPA